MNQPLPSSAVIRVGTEQPDNPGRILHAGPLSVELDGGQLRYLRVNGVEALRAIAFLVRDENWGTYVPTLENLKVDQRRDGFSVSYRGRCERDGMKLAFDIVIEGHADGSLDFEGVATPGTDFRTARTGFVILHPLAGVVGRPLRIEHVDGRVEKSVFPQHVNPVQPFLHVRALTHSVLPGVEATVRMEGDTWETEDHRNWTDASFKTYVRPLALPWPYTLPAGVPVKQSVRFSLGGKIPEAARSSTAAPIGVKLGAVSRRPMPAIGVGMPAGEIEHSIQRLSLLRRLGPRVLVCHFDPRAGHGLKELYGFRVLAEQTGARATLEIVVASIDSYATELKRLAALVTESGLKLSAIAVCPVGDLKSVLPAGERPPAPPLDALYAAARAAFPGVELGGGMLSFFTELNRKRPPADLLDFVVNTTCPIVHAADDRAVMETLAALPYQIETARSFIGDARHRVGPSAIGCRDNPHGATFTPNPANERVCLAQADPRTRALFGAAWTLGYVATLARTTVDAVTFGAPTGPLGFIHCAANAPQPWFEKTPGAQVYPAFHVLTGLARSAGCRQVTATSSDNTKIETLAWKAKGGTVLWIANLTANDQAIALSGLRGEAFVSILDEARFVEATTDPAGFQAKWKSLPPAAKLRLGAYAVAMVSVND